MKIWFLLVYPNFRANGRRFQLEFDPSTLVDGVKGKIKARSTSKLKHIETEDLTVWKPRGNNVITTSQGLAKILQDIDVNDRDAIEELYEEVRVEDLELSDGETLLVQLPATTVDHEASVDRVPELTEFKRYYDTVVTQGPSPSEGAKSTGYRKIQADVAQVIYDGRRAPDGTLCTIGPPIQIFHPIFGDFIRLVNHPDVQPTARDLQSVYELMYYVSEVRRSEDHYNEGLRQHLRDILNADVHEEPNPDRTMPDGVITLQIGTTRIAYLIVELEREVGEGGCDPTTQAGLSMKRSWINASREAVREVCCCPTFLIAAGGPWLSVLGGVFTDKIIVQRLTDMRWMALSSTEEDDRVYRNARIFVALRNCLVRLQEYYSGLKVNSPPPFAANEPHPRYFPYPTSFVTEDNSVTNFRYLRSLESDAACVTYLAEIPSETGVTEVPQKVVIKFVARYGEEAHKFLARKGWAPTLRYCGPLPDAELCGVIPEPAQKAPPGLCLRSNLMHMVVMDYVHAQPNIPPNVREQIQTVLTLLHSEGHVFGDLRKQNILFDNGKVKLIDFNWCGRYDMNIRDKHVPDDLQSKIDKNKDHFQVGENEIYVYYPLSMSTVKGMWASGIEPLAPIRPEHDWMMLEKLSW